MIANSEQSMMQPYNTPPKTYIFAHRGARCEAPDNTRQAFDKAISYGADGIETDVQLTEDEISVLWHDRFLDKLGYPDKHIDDFSFSELQKLNFSGYFPNTIPESIISLHEFIDKYSPLCKLQIEIKNRDWEVIKRHQIKIQQCLKFLSAKQNPDVFISSFNFNSLYYAYTLESPFPLVYALKESHTTDEINNVINHHAFLNGYCLPISCLNAELVKILQNLNKMIVTYTCNSEQEINKALELQVDVLITDNPRKALKMRDP